MNEYIVAKDFTDKNTKQLHKAGESYPAESAVRAKELQEKGFLHPSQPENSDDELDERLERVGGGYYKLPNGDKVRGKEAAVEALRKLDEAANEES